LAEGEMKKEWWVSFDKKKGRRIGNQPADMRDRFQKMVVVVGLVLGDNGFFFW
jgi:hypothetical protein